MTYIQINITQGYAGIKNIQLDYACCCDTICFISDFIENKQA